MTLPGPEYYLNAPTDINAFKDHPDKITKQYRQLIQSVITLLGGRPHNQAVDQILLFERQLAFITIPARVRTRIFYIFYEANYEKCAHSYLST